MIDFNFISKQHFIPFENIWFIKLKDFPIINDLLLIIKNIGFSKLEDFLLIIHFRPMLFKQQQVSYLNR